MIISVLGTPAAEKVIDTVAETFETPVKKTDMWQWRLFIGSHEFKWFGGVAMRAGGRLSEGNLRVRFPAETHFYFLPLPLVVSERK